MKKNIYIILILILTFSCKENSPENKSTKLKPITKKTAEKPNSEQAHKNTIFDLSFRNFKELDFFKDYEKNVGTVINYKESKWEYSFQELQNGNRRVILFNKIIETGKPKKDFKILDTIVINNLKENEFISIGICSNSGEFDPRIIAVIEDDINSVELENFKNIKRAWKANLDSLRIERITEIEGIQCLNEGFGL